MVDASYHHNCLRESIEAREDCLELHTQNARFREEIIKLRTAIAQIRDAAVEVLVETNLDAAWEAATDLTEADDATHQYRPLPETIADVNCVGRNLDD